MTGSVNFEPANGAADGPYGDIVYLTEGPDGALYYVDLGYSDDSGQFGVSKIRRIRYVQSNQAPISIASGNPTTGTPPLDVTFSSAGLERSRGPTAYLPLDVRRQHHLDRRRIRFTPMHKPACTRLVLPCPTE